MAVFLKVANKPCSIKPWKYSHRLIQIRIISLKIKNKDFFYSKKKKKNTFMSLKKEPLYRQVATRITGKRKQRKKNKFHLYDHHQILFNQMMTHIKAPSRMRSACQSGSQHSEPSVGHERQWVLTTRSAIKEKRPCDFWLLYTHFHLLCSVEKRFISETRISTCWLSMTTEISQAFED